MEEQVRYNAGNKVRPEVYAAAMRFRDFLGQFAAMTQEEKKVCIERIESLGGVELAEFYNVLAERMERKGTILRMIS